MKKVLILEDTKSFAMLISAHVDKLLGKEYDVATTCAEAVQKLNENPTGYSVITVDMHLPDADEIEIIDQLAPFNIPCVVLTGDMSDSLREDVLSSTIVADYVMKKMPKSLEYVCQSIDRLEKNQDVSVLVVDDSRTARRHLSRILATQQVRVFEAADAKEALKVYNNHPEITLMLIDGHMEGASGLELTIALRTVKGVRDLSIIGISGAYNKQESINFLKAGANDYLSKPFSQEELTSRINQQLTLLDQMTALERVSESNKAILRMAAHDIRNPLSNLVSLADLMKNRLDDPVKVKQMSDLFSTSANNMLTLLNSLLDYAAMDEGNLDPHMHSFVLGEELKATIKDLELGANQKNISVNVNIPADLKVLADPTLIRQVIYNLASNAIKFSKEGTSVDISASTNYANALRVNIEDQGPGVKEEEQEKLFKPFTMLSNKSTAGEPSSGLGLAICKRIMDSHKGKIGYEDRQGQQGSCFYIELDPS